jgi:hypothetical protein
MAKNKCKSKKKPALPPALALNSVGVRNGGVMESIGTGWYNPKSSSKEIKVVLTDFFDSTDGILGTYQQWLFSPVNPFFPSAAGSADANLGKVTKVRFYALPSFTLDTSASPQMVIFGLPVLASGVGACASQQSTLLTPTSVSDWVSVGGWDASKIFADANVIPAVNDATSATPLGSLRVVNPDDYSASSVIVQFMVQAHVSYTLPQITMADYVVGSSLTNDFTTVLSDPPVTGPILSQVEGMSNAL